MNLLEAHTVIRSLFLRVRLYFLGRMEEHFFERPHPCMRLHRSMSICSSYAKNVLRYHGQESQFPRDGVGADSRPRLSCPSKNCASTSLWSHSEEVWATTQLSFIDAFLCVRSDRRRNLPRPRFPVSAWSCRGGSQAKINLTIVESASSNSLWIQRKNWWATSQLSFIGALLYVRSERRKEIYPGQGPQFQHGRVGAVPGQDRSALQRTLPFSPP